MLRTGNCLLVFYRAPQYRYLSQAPFSSNSLSDKFAEKTKAYLPDAKKRLITTSKELAARGKEDSSSLIESLKNKSWKPKFFEKRSGSLRRRAGFLAMSIITGIVYNALVKPFKLLFKIFNVFLWFSFLTKTAKRYRSLKQKIVKKLK
ncbi:hypothetical protein L596_021921 [Steinernema carpocapsae]|uniref:Uncharacterized protein n=1 Tax=Steinernema carpocapsae TaxID=34508 RepID=A0A4U5MK77_STECR|nr:hypothetical protein L596_021921 [Steinernema carpocapsae]